MGLFKCIRLYTDYALALMICQLLVVISMCFCSSIQFLIFCCRKLAENMLEYIKSIEIFVLNICLLN